MLCFAIFFNRYMEQKYQHLMWLSRQSRLDMHIWASLQHNQSSVAKSRLNRSRINVSSHDAHKAWHASGVTTWPEWLIDVSRCFFLNQILNASNMSAKKAIYEEVKWEILEWRNRTWNITQNLLTDFDSDERAAGSNQIGTVLHLGRSRSALGHRLSPD